MSVEAIFDNYYDRAILPIRNTKYGRVEQGGFDIRHVVEDDEFRQLNHKIVLKDGTASCVWREQEWGLGENSLDVTHISNGIVQAISLRHTGDAVTGMKLSLSRNDWLAPDPDFRLPYIFGRSDMESWYRVSDFTMRLDRMRLAWDKDTKHSYPVRDIGIDRTTAEHLYKGVEYRVDLNDGIQLNIDEKDARKINWRSEISSEEVLRLFEYVSGDIWMHGWGPVADIIES